MIYLLHGSDIDASYQRLRSLLTKYQTTPKIRLTQENSQEEFYMALFSEDLFSKEKIVVCENFLTKKKLSFVQFTNLPKEKKIIFWEHQQLSTQLIAKLQKFANVENFKQKGQIYKLLDSINPNLKIPLSDLQKIDSSEENLLIWNLTVRTLLLIFAKLGMPVAKAEEIIERKIYDWQWHKITSQEEAFSMQTLVALYNGLVRLDFMIKKGQTNLDQKTLVSILLLKYLRG